MKYLPIILSLGVFILLIRVFRKAIVSYLLKLRGRLTVASIRNAIQEADKDKEKTGRKNMVVFNTASGSFEPVQKKLLKGIARKNRNRSNAKQTDGRKRYLAQNPKEKSYLTSERVKTVEKKSLYTTN